MWCVHMETPDVHGISPTRQAVSAVSWVCVGIGGLTVSPAADGATFRAAASSAGSLRSYFCRPPEASQRWGWSLWCIQDHDGAAPFDELLGTAATKSGAASKKGGDAQGVLRLTQRIPNQVPHSTRARPGKRTHGGQVAREILAWASAC